MKGKFWLSLLLSALLLGFLWLYLRDIPIAQVFVTLAGLSAWQITLLFVLNFAILLLFGGRWWIILRSMGHFIRYFTLTIYRIAGFSISYFTPGPQVGGEPLQVLLIHRYHGIATSQAVSSVFLDKVIDALVNFTFLVFGLTTIIVYGYAPGNIRLWMLGLPFLAVLFPSIHLYLLWRGVLPLSSLLKAIAPAFQRWKKVAGFFEIVIQTETDLSEYFRKRPLAILNAALLSGLTWGVLIFEYGLMLRFLGLQLKPVEIIGAFTAARLAFLAPVPAGLGALEASQVLALQSLGYSPALGISLSLLIRTRDILVGLLGLVAVGRLVKKAPAAAPVIHDVK